MEWLIKLGLKLVSYQTLVEVIAQALAYIMDYARKNASKDGWENAKKAVHEVRNWTTLFDEVYEDDTLTPEEEKKIQNAIANCTVTTSIYNLIKGKKAPKKETWTRTTRPAKKPAKKESTKKKRNNKK